MESDSDPRFGVAQFSASSVALESAIQLVSFDTTALINDLSDLLVSPLVSFDTTALVNDLSNPLSSPVVSFALVL